MYCSSCGTQTTQDARFCHKCGGNLVIGKTKTKKESVEHSHKIASELAITRLEKEIAQLQNELRKVKSSESSSINSGLDIIKGGLGLVVIPSIISWAIWSIGEVSWVLLSIIGVGILMVIYGVYTIFTDSGNDIRKSQINQEIRKKREQLTKHRRLVD